ncbi:hypothetical protein VKT23_015130 [Stygiomarasmius scandens]|uniref:WD40 repeat-like protein n=1 Tax=Marasmiellus scandens TaxID=2682957 RepID=A0ABR1J383_9AGAR
MASSHVFVKSLSSHRGAIIALSMTENGDLLASGGSDGVKIWDMRKFTEISLSGSWHGAVTSLGWLRRPDCPEEILIYGTHTGYIAGWRQVEGNTFVEVVNHSGYMHQRSEVTALAFDPVHDTIAACNLRGAIQLYRLEDDLGLKSLFAVNLGGVVPKYISFIPGSLGPHRDILVLNARGEHAYTLRGTDGKIIGQDALGCTTLNAQVHDTEGFLVVQEAGQGLAVYDLEGFGRVDTFTIQAKRNVPKPCQVATSPDGSILASGSDHGMLYLFDRRSGQCIDRLQTHSKDEWVQAVGIFADNIGIIILAAHSQDFGIPNHIQVWRAKADIKRFNKRQMLIMFLLHVFVLGNVIETSLYLFYKPISLVS